MPRRLNTPARSRGVQIGIRLTEEEADEIYAQAERRGMPITLLILEAVRAVAGLPFDGAFRLPDAPPPERAGLNHHTHPNP